MLPINNKKAYMGSPKTLAHLTLSDIEVSKSTPLDLEVYIL